MSRKSSYRALHNANDNVGATSTRIANAELLFKANRAIGDFRSSLLRFNPFHDPAARKKGRLLLVLCRDSRRGASVFFLHRGVLYSLTVFFAAQS